MRRLALLAGEPSGDALGAGLMRALRAASGPRRPVEFVGVGGGRMADEGLELPWFPMRDLSVMGFSEVLPRLVRLRRRLREATARVLEARPDVVVTVDSKGFNFRLMEAVRAQRPEQRWVHYVSPSTWATRDGARSAARLRAADEVLTLLPFEPECLRALGVPRATFVGHPAAFQQAPRPPSREGAGAGTVALLPGSREHEVKRNLVPALAGAVAGGARAVLVVAAPETEPLLRYMLGRWRKHWPMVGISLVTNAPWLDLNSACTAAVVVSGTAVTEVALAGVPQVVLYRSGWLTELVARRVATVEHASLANILARRAGDEAPLPELLFRAVTVDAVGEQVARLLGSQALREEQVAAAQRALAALRLPGDRDPSEAAAERVMKWV